MAGVVVAILTRCDHTRASRVVGLTARVLSNESFNPEVNLSDSDNVTNIARGVTITTRFRFPPPERQFLIHELHFGFISYSMRI